MAEIRNRREDEFFTPSPNDPEGAAFDRDIGQKDRDLSPYRPVDWGWYDFTPEQRAAFLVTSWVLVNLGINSGNMELVPDEAILTYAWAAQDVEAKNALSEDERKIVLGEGLNEFGLYRVPMGESNAERHLEELADRISDVEGQGSPSFLSNFTKYMPGGRTQTLSPTMDLFTKAADGGKHSRTAQDWANRSEGAINAGVIATGVMIGGGAILGPKLATMAPKLAGFLARVAGRGSAIRGARNIWFGSSVATYGASLALGMILEPAHYLVDSIRMAVDAGEMDPDQAKSLISVLYGADDEKIPDAIKSTEWWNESTVDTSDPINTYMVTSQPVSDEEGEEGEPTPTAAFTPATDAMKRGYYASDWAVRVTGPPVGRQGTAPAEYGMDDFWDSADERRIEQARLAAEEEQKQAWVTSERRRRNELRMTQQGGVLGGFSPLDRVQPTLSKFDPFKSPAFADVGDDPTLSPFVGTKALYNEGNVRDEIGNWSMETTEWFQRQAVLAGIIDDESFVAWGRRDSTTRNALSIVFEHANNTGDRWRDALVGMVGDYQNFIENKPKPARQGFVEPAYLAPDYATLAQRTKQEFTRRLGRRPTQAEMNMFSSYLGEQDRNEFDANVQAQRQEWSARGRQFDTEVATEGTESPNVSAGTVQGVDAESRFQEYFGTHYKGEIAHRERVDQNMAKRPGLFASLNRIAGSM